MNKELPKAILFKINIRNDFADRPVKALFAILFNQDEFWHSLGYLEIELPELKPLSEVASWDFIDEIMAELKYNILYLWFHPDTLRHWQPFLYLDHPGESEYFRLPVHIDYS